MLTNILNTWYELHNLNPSMESDIQQESLWYNNNITINKSLLWWRKWINAGIYTINDILHADLPR